MLGDRCSQCGSRVTSCDTNALVPAGGRLWIVPSDEPSIQPPPGWAVNRAAADLYEIDDPDVIAERAWELVHEAEQLEDERHDEYDDPDQGGEG